MKYLVLRSFRCYGKMLRKGEVVDESAIRSPRLRLSEGKIILAKEEPIDSPAPKKAAAKPASQKSAVISSGATKQPVVAAPSASDAPSKEESKPVRLSFG